MDLASARNPARTRRWKSSGSASSRSAELARSNQEHYLIVDATAPPGEITELIKDRIREVLPDPVPHVSEANTGSFPAIRDHHA